MGNARLAIVLVLASALWGCDLSMVGKDRCLNELDCLEGSSCVGGVCLESASCPNPCGASCCDSSETCSASLRVCVSTCQPDCAGRQCGDNGCGGSCGPCGSGYQCNESGFCEQCSGDSQAWCQNQGRLCGPDNCGRTCGSCSLPQYCNLDTFQCETLQPDAGAAFSDAGFLCPPDAAGTPNDANVATDAAVSSSDGGEEAGDAAL